MATTFLENYYAFRYSTNLIDQAVVSGNPENATLASIEANLSAANAAFLSRSYQQAIGLYQEAAGQIYALIDPQFSGSEATNIKLPTDAGLFDGLLSASAEYLNLLPINTPAPGPRSRVSIASNLTASTALVDQTGIQSAQASTPQAKSALSDWQLAQNYDALGMTQTAAFYQQRAQTEDSTLLTTLSQSSSGNAPSPTPTPIKPVVAPTTPAAPIAMAPGATAATTTTPMAATITGSTDTALKQAVVERGTIVSSETSIITKLKLPPPLLEGRSAGTLVSGKLVQFSWAAGSGPPTATIQSSVYAARASLASLPDILLNPQQPSDIAMALPHDYYYVIPLALAECYAALGDYATAESYYLQAASYQYINLQIEAPYVWLQLATLYSNWGDSLFKSGQAQNALNVYINVLTPDMKAPTTQLYTLPNFKGSAATASSVIAALPNVKSLTVNPQVIAAILDVRQQLLKIAAGLDFWGNWSSSVPIWTFDYLQQIAQNFAQLAVNAERDVINFWNNADQGQLTRQQLSDQLDQANANAYAAQMQLQAAQAQQQVYADGVTLAQQRAIDAQNTVTQYQNLAPLWAVMQAQQNQVSGGDNGDPGQLNGYAQQLMSGGSISDSQATVAAAVGLAGTYYNQQYELATLQMQVSEMNDALTQAQDEQTAAAAQTNVAQAQADAASVRAADAVNDLSTFDSQTFTPDVWNRMGNAMLALYQRYFSMALKTAMLMQAAYNFETDQTLSIIKNSYATDEVNGLLGADLLMADIESFSYELITTTQSKPQPVKQTISLASRYAYLFESQLRKTGVMDFQTQVEDFENLYPGTYAGRIQTVEIEVDGIVPPTGISGTLTNSGISTYRLPAASWTKTNAGKKYRVQPSETLVISDYSPRNDTLVAPTDPNQLRIFQGAGVASTWHLELPPSINDLDYGSLIDVKLTFSYEARFDPNLKAQVLTAITSTAGYNARQLGLPLRWIYPDAFFAFQNSGTLTFSLAQSDFPYNQRNPVITDVAIAIAANTGSSASGITVTLATPTQTTAVAAKTDSNGTIDAATSGSPWKALATGTALGNYTLAVTAANNPSLVKNGVLTLSGIANISFMLGYSFTVRT